jgi:hypothetical protein
MAADPREQTGEHMAKLIQICASQDDLFGLDDAGTVYQYNFSTKSWIELGGARHDQRPASFPGAETASPLPGTAASRRRPPPSAH